MERGAFLLIGIFPLRGDTGGNLPPNVSNPADGRRLLSCRSVERRSGGKLGADTMEVGAEVCGSYRSLIVIL